MVRVPAHTPAYGKRASRGIPAVGVDPLASGDRRRISWAPEVVAVARSNAAAINK